MIIQPCALNLWRGWWAIDFQVPKSPFFCSVQIELSFRLGNRFSLFGSSVFFTHFTSILQKFSRLFSYNSYLHLSLFCRGVVFRFLAFGFISHTTRISNNTSFLCKRLVVKYKFRNNLSRFTKLKGVALLLKTWTWPTN